MRSSAAFRAACLAAGVATAWSPLATQPAKAGSVVDLAITNGTSPFHIFDNAYIGFSFVDNSDIEITSLGDLTGLDHYSFPVPLHGLDDFDQFVLVGLSVNDVDHTANHVVVSFASTEGVYSHEFDEIFAPANFPDETHVASHLPEFIQAIFSNPPSGVLQSLTGTDVREGFVPLVAFTPGEGAGNITVSVSPSAVPLPSGIMMGGTLLAMLASGRRAHAWLFGRQPA